MSGLRLSNTVASSSRPIPVVFAIDAGFSPSSTLYTFAAMVNPSSSMYLTTLPERSKRPHLLGRRVFIDRMGEHRFDGSHAVDKLPQFRRSDRRRHIGAEHLAAQGDVHLHEARPADDGGKGRENRS